MPQKSTFRPLHSARQRTHIGLDTVDSDFAKAASSILNFLASEGHKEVILIPWSHTIFDQGLGYAWRFLDSAIETANVLT